MCIFAALGPKTVVINKEDSLPPGKIFFDTTTSPLHPDMMKKAGWGGRFLINKQLNITGLMVSVL